jgi:hypothetical protein
MDDLYHRGDKTYWPEPPTDEEIEHFTLFRNIEDGPTSIDFRPDFSHQPPKNNPWNKRAAEVYVQQYQHAGFLAGDYDDRVEDEFWKRLKRLGEKYRKHVAAEDAQSQSAASAKHQRRRRRTETVKTFPDFL